MSLLNKDYHTLSPILDRMKYFFRRGHAIGQLSDWMHWYVFPKIFKVADFPIHIDVEAASACQLACPQCTNTIMDSKIKGVMPFDIFKRVVDESAARGVINMKLSWRGEPMLNPRIWDMVKYAKSAGIPDVAFLSNGERMKVPEDLENMMDSGLDWISFSADGLGETYDRIRAPSKFTDFVSKIEALRDLKLARGTSKPLVRLQSIFSAIRDDPDAFLNFWKTRVDRVNYISDEARSDAMRDFPQDPDYVCPAPWQRIVVDHKGNARPCVCDYFERNIMGNVMEQSLYDIWHGQRFTELRMLQKEKRRMEKDYCAECCHGGKMESTPVTIRGKEYMIQTYVGQKAVGQGLGQAPVTTSKHYRPKPSNPHITTKDS